MILITGASRGIGKYIYDKYKNEGKEVIGFYNNTKPTNTSSNLYQVDISDYGFVANWVKEHQSNLSKIVLINCAGINYNKFAHKSEIENWEKVIKVNLIGTFNLIKNLLSIMRSEKYGRIITFSSVVGQKGVPGTSAYAASKSALWGMTKALAVENASKGITINNINLGYMNIGMISELPEAAQELLKGQLPTGNFGDPADILPVIEGMINSGYVNGSSWDLNGGYL